MGIVTGELERGLTRTARRTAKEVILDDGEVPLDDLLSIALHGGGVRLSSEPSWREKIEAGRRVLEESLREEHRVYGVSTGIGHTSSHTVAPEERTDFAASIVRQHGCGMGEPLTVEESRATLFARLVSLTKGYSAVRPRLLEMLAALINRDIVPVIPRYGSVGASGDLTPLSYVAAVLMGEREARYGGEIMPSSEALDRAGLKPLRLVPKESLAIMNGTAVMTALGAITVGRLEHSLSLCERTSALAAEILYGRSAAYHEIVHEIKPHPGQAASAAAIRAALEGSRMIDEGQSHGRVVQDPYSLRCAPHVLGAARDAAAWARTVLHRELNSVNDNPIVDAERGEIFCAGNFYGGHVALAMDLLKITAASVADLCDRQFGLLVDSRFNMGLPETLVTYEGCGLKALQVTSSALAALAAQGTASDTVLSRSSDADNQDKVSMGTNAALHAAETVTVLQRVIATELLALSNAATSRDERLISPAGSSLLAEVRKISPVLEHDRRLDGELLALVNHIDGGEGTG
jgi:histidine ammonia-lyase